MKHRRFFSKIFTFGVCFLCVVSGSLLVGSDNLTSGLFAEEEKDTREGEDVSLECRFAPVIAGKNPKYFWLRTNKRNHDNVAVQDTPLESNYRIDFRPELGRYDLLISNTSYDRDNGKFECRVKAAGSGQDLHSQSYTLTVLTPPGPPRISPGPNPTVTEGRKLELSCSSVGGSPEPTMKWYRDGSSQPLDVAIRRGKDDVTMAVLTLNPGKQDDGGTFRCFVWNRAMPDANKMEASVSLNVNYFPRVTVGPENPLRVERDGTATLQCSVDAKPKVSSVRWTRNGRFIATAYSHNILRVGIMDSGKYTCSAENGLGQTGEAEIQLDVLYPPTVTIESTSGATRHREAEEGEAVTIRCNVSANPAPYIVEWLREGHPGFRQSGELLRLPGVSAESAGTYICRAVNVLTPSQSKRRFEKVGNASMTLLVRHKPGLAHISPERPIAAEGTGVTLTCSANPPGWPAPQYRWWRDSDGSSQGSSQTVLATGAKYMIPSAHMGSEGRYHCQATNEMGHGEPSSVVLQVHQPPRLVAKLQPHVTRRAGSADFSVKCGAQGKPKPIARWLKDGKEINENQDEFEILNEESDGRNSVYTVQTTLRFLGRGRPDGNQLEASDRGVYVCAFENEVKRAESSMHLKIEHEPIILHQYNKVAHDVRETAEVLCRVQAYPRPEFQWSLVGNSAPLSPSSGLDSHYDISTSAESSDVYTSILRISNVQESDYGEYTCRIGNGLGSLKTGIRLQPKGQPDSPVKLRSVRTGSNYITLGWTPGFDGGIQNTKYFVAYRRASQDNRCVDGSSSTDRRTEGWQEHDCQTANPCNVTSLEPHHTYRFKVKSYNTKGNSNYSEEETASTKVDRVPAPLRVTYHLPSRTLSLNLPSTCLQLQAELEIETDGQWRIAKTITVTLGATDANAVLPDTVPGPPRLRVRLCLQSAPERCGDAVQAEQGPSFVPQATSIATPTLIAIVVSCIVFVLFAGVIVMFCRCKKQSLKKEASKEYEVEGVRPSIVQQPPPPYYPEAKTEDDPAKWVNMGYHETSYSNSVHSQDSLWAMKLANGNNNASDAHGYDPLAHSYDYSYDPYGPVHKQKKLPAHMDMTGLPDPYMGAMELEEPKNQHVSLSFDESLESGYSTPNSRNRRIIREIIV